MTTSNTLNSSGWRKDVPWLYYLADNQVALYDADAVPFEVSFDSNAEKDKQIHEFNYFITSYAVDGTYLGIEPLTNQLNFCEDNYKGGLDFRKFGRTIEFGLFPNQMRD